MFENLPFIGMNFSFFLCVLVICTDHALAGPECILQNIRSNSRRSIGLRWTGPSPNMASTSSSNSCGYWGYFSPEDRDPKDTVTYFRNAYGSQVSLATGGLGFVFTVHNSNAFQLPLAVKALPLTGPSWYTKGGHLTQQEVGLTAYLSAQMMSSGRNTGFPVFYDAFGGNMLSFLKQFCISSFPHTCDQFLQEYITMHRQSESGIKPTKTAIDTQFIVMRQFSGPTLDMILLSKKFEFWGSSKSARFTLSILLQMIHLSARTHRYFIYHIDPHLKNWIFDRSIDLSNCYQNTSELFELDFGSGKVVSVPAFWTCGARLQLIDFGMAFYKKGEIYLGPKMFRYVQSRSIALSIQLRFSVVFLLSALSCRRTSYWILLGRRPNTNVVQIMTRILTKLFGLHSETDDIMEHRIGKTHVFSQLCRPKFEKKKYFNEAYQRADRFRIYDKRRPIEDGWDLVSPYEVFWKQDSDVVGSNFPSISDIEFKNKLSWRRVLEKLKHWLQNFKQSNEYAL